MPHSWIFDMTKNENTAPKNKDNLKNENDLKNQMTEKMKTT